MNAKWITVLVALHCVVVSTVVGAQAYPNRPVRLIVPFPPGGGVDITNRIVAAKLTEVIGQQIVIENRSGASGNLGAEIAAKATPDGYTLFACNVASHGVSPAIYRKLAFDAVKDFAPIARYGTTPNVLVIHPAVPAKTVADIVKALNAPETRERFAQQSLELAPTTREEFAAFIKAEIAKWTKVVQAAHVTVE